MRIRKNEVLTPKFRRSNIGKSKKPRPGSDKQLIRGSKCAGGMSIASFKEVPREKRTRQCAFCGRQRASHMCRSSCGAHLCDKTPKTMNGKRFPKNGPCCFLRYHGITSFPPA